MTPADQATLLLRTIDFSEGVLFRQPPALEAIEELAETVRARAGAPLEDPALRFVDEFAALLLTCLARIVTCRRNDVPQRAALWGQIAGVLLPHVRAQLSRAIEARRNTRPTP